MRVKGLKCEDFHILSLFLYANYKIILIMLTKY